MYNKTWLCIIAVVLSVIFVCGCTAKKADTGVNHGQGTTEQGSDSSAGTTDPTEYGVADSIFDDVSRAPTATNNETEVTKDQQETKDPESTDGTEPEEPTVEATVPDVAPEEMTYEAFIALTPAEQRLYQESFDDLDAFFAWYNAAKEKYEKENPPIDIDGPIDLGKL